MKREQILTTEELATILQACKTTVHTWIGRYTLTKYLTNVVEDRFKVKFRLNDKSYKELIQFLKTKNKKSEQALRAYWESREEPEKRLKSIWFTPMSGHCIGIVKTPTDKVYIGVGKGVDEEEDKKYIAKYGTPIDLQGVIKSLQIEVKSE